MTDRSGRTGLALAVAPLAAPFAMWAALVARAAVVRPDHADASSVVVSALFVGFVMLVAGAPLAYASTITVVWPWFSYLRSIGRARWWLVAGAAALAGELLFPLYLRLIEPRGSITFFPGAGFVAGAASGWVFWRLASGPDRR